MKVRRQIGLLIFSAVLLMMTLPVAIERFGWQATLIGAVILAVLVHPRVQLWLEDRYYDWRLRP